jgi:hypothetical protein
MYVSCRSTLDGSTQHLCHRHPFYGICAHTHPHTYPTQYIKELEQALAHVSILYKWARGTIDCGTRYVQEQGGKLAGLMAENKELRDKVASLEQALKQAVADVVLLAAESNPEAIRARMQELEQAGQLIVQLRAENEALLQEGGAAGLLAAAEARLQEAMIRMGWLEGDRERLAAKVKSLLSDLLDLAVDNGDGLLFRAGFAESLLHEAAEAHIKLQLELKRQLEELKAANRSKQATIERLVGEVAEQAARGDEYRNSLIVTNELLMEEMGRADALGAKAKEQTEKKDIAVKWLCNKQAQVRQKDATIRRQRRQQAWDRGTIRRLRRSKKALRVRTKELEEQVAAAQVRVVWYGAGVL